MSEKLCTLRTKGGGGGGATYTETVLWTNSAPTSDFAAQTITLSDGMSNYKYLAIAFKAHKTSTDTVRTIISVEDLGKLESSLNKPLIRFAGTNSTPTSVSRQFLKVSDTTISIGGGYYTNTSGSSNSYAIPTEILGLNELAQGKNGGPMFEIMTGSGGSTTNYSARVATNDDTLVSVDSSQAQSGTVTIKRAAKGKIYFGYCARGTNATRPSFTINNVSYNPQAYDTQTQAGISVSFEANDTIAFSSGRSGSFDVGTLTFIEDA